MNATLQRLMPASRARLRALAALALASLLTATASAQQDADPKAGDNDSAAIHRLVYLGRSGPLFLKLDLTIDGQPISAFRRSFVLRQFEQFDKDSDGRLSPGEAESVPSFGKSTNGEQLLGDDWKSLDSSPTDGHLTLAELLPHYETFMGPPFSLTRRIQDGMADVDLVAQLDTTSDRSISEDELKSGHEVLRLLDLDDDETISAAELAPLSDPAGQPSFVTESENGQQAYPFVLLSADADLQAIADQILKQYDRGSSEGDSRSTKSPTDSLPADDSPGELDREEIPASYGQLLQFDADRNRTLSAAELVEALQQPGESLAVTVAMPKYGRPSVSQPRLRDRPIEFSVKRWAGASSDTINFFRIQMLRIDADKNRYLDRQEFAGLDLEGATFDVVDRDGNDQVVADEIVAYLEERASLSQLRVIMRVDLQRQSLFEILDTNSDQRLTRREFLLGPEQIAAFDTNRNRSLDAAEIESRYHVTFELARPGLIPNSQTMMQQGSNSPVLQGSTDGPEWFRRMDLNQDGDVSRREFLGPASDFTRFDTDRDGALSAEEALAAASSTEN